MPSAVNAILGAASTEWPRGLVAWGERPELDSPGIYLIGLTADVGSATGTAVPPVWVDRCRELLDARPELTLDGEHPDATVLSERLAAFWLPDEPILYIGLAGTSVASRVADYYRTPLGARRPHSGGWFLKTLKVLPELWVHFAPCDDPRAAEAAALGSFAAGVSASSRERLRDSERAMPFANLEFPRGTRKRHGIAGAREPKEGKSRAGVRHPPELSPERGDVQIEQVESVTPYLRTQRITAADLRAGQIRVPAQTKRLFPNEKARVSVELLGEILDCRWDPRPGRSGVIGVGKAQLSELVDQDQVLRVEAFDSGVRLS